jgi:ADP-ribosylglycohydrolase
MIRHTLPIAFKWPTVLRGVAYGDSWGYKNEFKSYRDLVRDDLRGPDFPKTAMVSDDTQMTLYLARALNGVTVDTDPAVIQARIIAEFVSWMDDPENFRAPGTTCMGAVGELSVGVHWQTATRVGSMGCGAIMRVAPAALLPDGLWQPVSAWQAAATHGHPAAIAAALLTAALIRQAAQRRFTPGNTLRHAHILTHGAELDYHLVADWLIDHPLAGSRQASLEMLGFGMSFVRRGIQQAQRSMEVFADNPWSGDPSDDRYGGQGWDSVTALATSLMCIDLFPGAPISAMRRAVTTGGDSDSLGAIAGSILGALYDNPWPNHWFDRLEPQYQTWIAGADRYSLAGE